MVTGVSVGTVTITATRNDGKTAKTDINVLNSSVPFKTTNNGETINFAYDSSKNINNIIVELDDSNYASWPYIRIEFGSNSYVKMGYSGSTTLVEESKQGNITTQISGKQLSIEFTNNYKPEYVKIIQDGGTSTSGIITINYASSRMMSRVMKASQRSGTLVQEITISGSDTDWTKTVSNLDVYDSDGKPYYYWAVEETVSGYDVSYLFDDDDDMTDYCINSSLFGKGEITVKNTKQESQGIEMPSTGGKGSEPYELIGLVIAGGALTILCVRRRRKNY